MKETGGKANPKVVSELLREKLNARDRRGQRDAAGQGLLGRAPERGRRRRSREGAAQGHEDPQPVLRHGRDRAAGRPRLRAHGGGARQADADPARAPRLLGGPDDSRSRRSQAPGPPPRTGLAGRRMGRRRLGRDVPGDEPGDRRGARTRARMGAAETRRAIEAAEARLPGWRAPHRRRTAPGSCAAGPT